MTKFPVDAPIRKVIRAFERLGFQVVREGNHISMARENTDGSGTLMTIPSHRTIKGSTLRTVLNQAGIGRDEFLDAYRRYVGWDYCISASSIITISQLPPPNNSLHLTRGAAQFNNV